MTTYADDIPLDLARRAHAGTSFDPDRRATQERDGYAAALAADLAALSKYADTDEKKATLEDQFARYRRRFRASYMALLESKAHCLSTMIAGPSNFNTRRAQKASENADKHAADLVEFRNRALAAIRKALQPELAPIALGDADAGDRLETKIAKLEAVQAAMKEANATIRKNAKAGAEAQITALLALGYSPVRAADLLKPDFCGRIGFADFEITNNGANIRRLKQRLGAVELAHATPAATVEGENARLEDVPAENRVRLFFPGKPDADVRERLKAGGFRWAPSLGCWSAYRNDRTLMIARAVAGEQTVAEAVRSVA